MKILFTGGGSGGHIFPIIAIVRELKRLNGGQNTKLLYAGPNDPQSLALLEQEGVATYRIIAGKFRRYFSLQNIIDGLLLPFSFLQAFLLLLFVRPRLVFSKGGTGSFPITYTARLLFIPVFVHESDMVAGISNRLTSTWAKKIFASFENTQGWKARKVHVVGTPIRKELLNTHTGQERQSLDIQSEKPVLLFWGGSQGAQPLNDFFALVANELLKNYEVVHVYGPNNGPQVAAQLEIMVDKNLMPSYHSYETINQEQLAAALKITALAISRAGSASIFELAAAGVPSFLVPLPGSAQNHQVKNAYAYAASGATAILEQQNLTPNFFIGKIENLLQNPEQVSAMRQAALAFAKPLAAATIAREILEYLAK